MAGIRRKHTKPATLILWPLENRISSFEDIFYTPLWRDVPYPLIRLRPEKTSFGLWPASFTLRKKVIYCLFGHSKNFIYYWKLWIKISSSMKFWIEWISCSYYLLFVPYLIRARNAVPIFQCVTSLLFTTEESNLSFVWIKICWSLKFQRFAYGVWWKKNLFILLIFLSTSKRQALFFSFIDSNIVWS